MLSWDLVCWFWWTLVAGAVDHYGAGCVNITESGWGKDSVSQSVFPLHVHAGGTLVKTWVCHCFVITFVLLSCASVFVCILVTFPLSSPGCRSFPWLSPALGKNDFSFPDILLMLEKKSRSFYPPHVSNPSPPPPPLLPPPLHWCGCKQSRVRQWCWCVVAGMWLLCLFATALIAHSDRSSVTECVCVCACVFGIAVGVTNLFCSSCCWHFIFIIFFFFLMGASAF